MRCSIRRVTRRFHTRYCAEAVAQRVARDNRATVKQVIDLMLELIEEDPRVLLRIGDGPIDEQPLRQLNVTNLSLACCLVLADLEQM